MEKRKRPLSVRAILQQPGAKKFARATPQQDAAHSVPFAQSEVTNLFFLEFLRPCHDSMGNECSAECAECGVRKAPAKACAAS
eukprot:s4012_g7.t1